LVEIARLKLSAEPDGVGFFYPLAISCQLYLTGLEA
jgi:hypothetical protein